MEQFITHACGHGQAHYLTGFASQQERKAQWLQTTKCRTCFIADKQSERAATAVCDNAAVSHLELSQLTGSERQISWATTIRAGRFATIGGSAAGVDPASLQACLAVIDAKWWIDNRDLPDTDLLAKASMSANSPRSAPEEMPDTNVARAA